MRTFICEIQNPEGLRGSWIEMYIIKYTADYRYPSLCVLDKERKEELLTLITTVLEHPEQADTLLPVEKLPFAQEEYDDDYFESLREAKRYLEKCVGTLLLHVSYARI